MKIYRMKIYFGHKFSMKMTVTEEVKENIQESQKPITYGYRTLGYNDEVNNKELTINPEFIQAIDAIETNIKDTYVANDRHQHFLKEDGLTSVEFFEY